MTRYIVCGSGTVWHIAEHDRDGDRLYYRIISDSGPYGTQYEALDALERLGNDALAVETNAALGWFCPRHLIDGPQADCPVCMGSLAHAALLTAGEAAAETGTSESLWRNRAASGQLPGAVKKGKTWLIPRPALAD